VTYLVGARRGLVMPGTKTLLYDPLPNSSIEECENYRYSTSPFPDLCHVQMVYATKTSHRVRINKRKKLYESHTTLFTQH